MVFGIAYLRVFGVLMFYAGAFAYKSENCVQTCLLCKTCNNTIAANNLKCIHLFGKFCLCTHRTTTTTANTQLIHNPLRQLKRLLFQLITKSDNSQILTYTNGKNISSHFNNKETQLTLRSNKVDKKHNFYGYIETQR